MFTHLVSLKGGVQLSYGYINLKLGYFIQPPLRHAKFTFLVKSERPWLVTMQPHKSVNWMLTKGLVFFSIQRVPLKFAIL